MLFPADQAQMKMETHLSFINLEIRHDAADQNCEKRSFCQPYYVFIWIFTFLSRSQICLNILITEYDLREKVLPQFSFPTARVALAVHCWSSWKYKGYMFIEAQRIDEHWELESAIPAFLRYYTLHTRETVCYILKGIIARWSLTKCNKTLRLIVEVTRKSESKNFAKRWKRLHLDTKEISQDFMSGELLISSTWMWWNVWQESVLNIKTIRVLLIVLSSAIKRWILFEDSRNELNEERWLPY